MADLTTEEIGLRVPLSALPGLDPRGLKVCDSSGGWWGWVLGPATHCPTTDRHGRCIAWPHADSDDACHALWAEDGLIALDLSDPATRDRVARWVAGRVGLQVGSTAPGWEYSDTDGGWLAEDGNVFVVIDPGFGLAHCVPALASLDPADPRLLPDGSRLVDAVALALVAQHVGGARG